jgi:hypothetical protein
MVLFLRWFLFFKYRVPPLWPSYIDERRDNICQSIWDESEVLLGTLWGTCQELGELFALNPSSPPTKHNLKKKPNAQFFVVKTPMRNFSSFATFIFFVTQQIWLVFMQLSLVGENAFTNNILSLQNFRNSSTINFYNSTKWFCSLVNLL